MSDAATAQETWIPVAAAARILRKSPRQVLYYVEAGLLRAERIGDRGWLRVSYEDVLKVMLPKS
jgi:hypothetical protein